MSGVAFQVPSTRISLSLRQELGWSLCFLFAHGWALSRLVSFFKIFIVRVPGVMLGTETRELSSKVPSAFGIGEESLRDIESKQIIIWVPAENTIEREFLGRQEPMTQSWHCWGEMVDSICPENCGTEKFYLKQDFLTLTLTNILDQIVPCWEEKEE